MNASVQANIAEFLAQVRTACLATADSHGRPHAANIQFASDSMMRLVWVSNANAAHSLHVSAKPSAALTVFHPDDRPEQIRGLQMHGLVEAIANAADRAIAWDLYAQKFPFVLQPQFRARVDSERFYRFTPTWWRWIDNRQKFGFKVESSGDRQI